MGGGHEVSGGVHTKLSNRRCIAQVHSGSQRLWWVCRAPCYELGVLLSFSSVCCVERVLCAAMESMPLTLQCVLEGYKAV